MGGLRVRDLVGVGVGEESIMAPSVVNKES